MCCAHCCVHEADEHSVHGEPYLSNEDSWWEPSIGQTVETKLLACSQLIYTAPLYHGGPSSASVVCINLRLPSEIDLLRARSLEADGAGSCIRSTLEVNEG